MVAGMGDRKPNSLPALVTMAGIVLALLVVADIAGTGFAFMFEITPFAKIGELTYWIMWIVIGGLAGVLSYVACIGIAVSGRPGDMHAMDTQGAKPAGRRVLALIAAICLALLLVIYIVLGSEGGSHYVPRSFPLTVAKFSAVILGAAIVQFAQERRRSI